MKIKSTKYSIPLKELAELLKVKGKIVRLVGFDVTEPDIQPTTIWGDFTGGASTATVTIPQKVENIIFEVEEE